MKRALVLVVLLLSGSGDGRHEFDFHHDFILGTSFDAWIRAADLDTAQACESALLDEIDRLNGILSTYDPSSEISRLNSTFDAVSCSPELFEVLERCETWRVASRGAFNPHLGKVIEAWSRSEIPDSTSLAAFVDEMSRPALELDANDRTARRLDHRTLRVDALAKGFIIERAVRAAQIPGVTGILLEIGGDLMAWGDEPWIVRVADPRHPEDNAPPLVSIQIQNRAVGTSGGYERFYQIGARRYSHIIDPRTCRPAEGVLGATAIAPDPATADALSTILCVLKPEEGLALIRDISGAECLIVDAAGKEHASPGWAALCLQDKPQNKKASKWPNNFQVSIDVTIAKPPARGKKYSRPFAAFWIEDSDGKAVRTLAVWGNESKYLKSLTEWWSFAKNRPEVVKTVTKATRGPGKYTLVWDGRDDKGEPLPPGTYTVRVETNREHGNHIKGMTCSIACKDKPAEGTIDGNVEVEGVKVVYGAPK